jgi:hypothetical protein
MMSQQKKWPTITSTSHSALFCPDASQAGVGRRAMSTMQKIVNASPTSPVSRKKGLK